MEKNKRNSKCLRSIVLFLTIPILIFLGLLQPHASQSVTQKNTNHYYKAANRVRTTTQNFFQKTYFQGTSQMPLGQLNVGSPAQNQRTKNIKKPYKQNEVLVKFKPTTGQMRASAVMNTLGIHPVKHFRMVDVHLSRTPPGKTVAETVRQLKKSPVVEYAEPNYIWYADEIIPDDPDFGLLWGLNNTGQSGGTVDADIDAPEAWEVQTGSSDVVIAVIDTGVDYEHVDLADNMWTNPGETPGDGIDNEGNGYIDDIHGINAISGSGDPMDDAADIYHGTHCAGTIAAQGNNGIGVTGVSWSSKIMALKFLGETGGGYTDDAVECIEYMVNMKNTYGVNVKVSSNSWGGGGYSFALRDAINLAKDSDIIFIAAAGNSSTDNDFIPHYPSSYDCLNIVSVAASDHNDQFASFSCYGYNTVDVAAPGVNIWSTKRGDDYQYMGGTSMATPHVAGLCSLISSQFPSMPYLEVKERLLRTVDTKSQFTDFLASGGRINAYAALTTAAMEGPFIFSISPGAASYGYELVIEGSQFGESQGTGFVIFSDSLTASVISWDDHQITCVVPNGCHTGPVTVTTDGGLQSNEKIFNLAASISGKVTDVDSGEGIEGIGIFVYNNAYDIKAIGTTDSNGDYSITVFPSGEYYVGTANFQGYLDKWYGDVDPNDCIYPIIHVEVPDDTPNIDFALAMGGSLSGQVISTSSGEELEDIQITVRDTDYSNSKYARTDSSGNFTINGLPTGDYYIRTYNYVGYIDEYYSDSLGTDNATVIHLEAPNSISGIDFALEDGGTISGHVTDVSNGEPLEEIDVSASYAGGNSVYVTKSDYTDSEGNYTITGLPTGNYRISTTYSFSNPTVYINEYYDDVLNSQSATLVSVNAPNNTPDIDFALAVGGSISGRVTDEVSGYPLDYLSVWVSDNWQIMGVVHPDSNGDYTLGGLPTGDYFVRTSDYSEAYVDEWFKDASYTDDDAPVVHVDTPYNTPDINFELSPYSEDTYESDNTPEEASLITSSGKAQTHTLYPEWDEDWIKFEAEEDTAYIITAFDTTPYFRVNLFLYNTDRVLLRDELFYSYNAQMVYTFTASGTYYIKIEPTDCFAPAAYKINVSRECASNIDCTDGLFCNGIESCMGNWCKVYTNDPCSNCSSNGCICNEDEDRCQGCNLDEDCDGICDPGASDPGCTDSDNCPDTPNGPYLGTCTWEGMMPCTTSTECGTDGLCSMGQEDADEDHLGDACDNCPNHHNPGQEDTFPPEGNGIGDACECEGDFDCDMDQDGSDAATFKVEFGRSSFNNPCTEENPCSADLDLDGVVDGMDAAKFKEDFGRCSYNNCCPPCAFGP